MADGRIAEMRCRLTLEYWVDDDSFVGRLREVPGVFSQGKTLEELEQNIRDAYALVHEDAAAASIPFATSVKEIEVSV